MPDNLLSLIKVRFLLLFSLLTLASACHPHADAAVSSSHPESSASALSASPSVSSSLTADHPPFTLPTIPASLRTPVDRAAYLVEHYWDHTPLSDPRVTRDTTRLEQFWVDYLSILPHVGDSALVAHTLTRITETVATSPDTTALTSFIELARHYLFDPDSPVYQTEDLYLSILQPALLANRPDGQPVLDFAAMEHCRLDYRMASQNREGTLAANFVYQLPDGRTSTLHTTPVGSHNKQDNQGVRPSDQTQKDNHGGASSDPPYLLLLFYDPDCDHCMETITQYRTSPEIAQAVADGRLSILAIDTEGSATRWRQTLDVFPSHWLVGFDRDMDILVNDLYSLRTMPTLLLLDSRYRVIRKNPKLPWLIRQMK